MHHDQPGEDQIELSCRIGELQVTIRGPSEPATALLLELTSRQRQRPSSPATSQHSFAVVSEDPGTPAPEASRRLETRAEIESTFRDCPQAVVAQGARLSGSATSGRDRIRRAWRAGQWAQAVASGRVRSPNRSAPLDLRSRFYAVLRAENQDQPTIYRSAASYWRAVGDLSTSTSISHAFPSEQEARIFFAGAETFDFVTLP